MATPQILLYLLFASGAAFSAYHTFTFCYATRHSSLSSLSNCLSHMDDTRKLRPHYTPPTQVLFPLPTLFTISQ